MKSLIFDLICLDKRQCKCRINDDNLLKTPESWKKRSKDSCKRDDCNIQKNLY